MTVCSLSQYLHNIILMKIAPLIIYQIYSLIGPDKSLLLQVLKQTATIAAWH